VREKPAPYAWVMRSGGSRALAHRPLMREG
jgi:hypothetical protein